MGRPVMKPYPLGYPLLEAIQQFQETLYLKLNILF